MHARADLYPKDEPALGDHARLLGRMRTRIAGWQRAIAIDHTDWAGHSRGSTGSDSSASTANTH